MSRQMEKQGIKKDVGRALIQAGFLKNGREKFSKKINAETEFFVYPGIGSTINAHSRAFESYRRDR